MPKPRKDEKKVDYMKRCIPYLIREGYDKKQAYAVCSSMYRKKK